ncbi:MAG: aminopeptidase [Lachnospiraceae bacterium]
MKKTLLKKYAELIVKMGANVQRDQEVIITAAVDQSELVKMVVREAYLAGAKKVTVDWTCQEVTKLTYRYETIKTLSSIPEWRKEKFAYQAETLPCMIYIESSGPDSLKGIDPVKMAKVQANRYPIIKPYNDAMENKYQWVIVAASSKEWAKKVFPKERTSVAVEKLWKLILDCAHVTEDNDPIEVWKQHNKSFEERSAWLNSLGLTELHYESGNGTNFTVGMHPKAKWDGGSEISLQGIEFNPNMPTEEIFTSPMKGKAEGVLVATKPLSYRGQLIDQFSITFKDGKAVDCHAEVGEAILRSMISADENAGYLGEVALIPVSSPINQSGVLFYNTLFDENASCHIALGRGFTNLLEGYENMTQEEMENSGINSSMIHVDFMIGSDDMKIVGKTQDGAEILIFENGTWANG